MGYVERVLEGSEKPKEGFPSLVYLILNSNIVARYILYIFLFFLVGLVVLGGLSVAGDGNSYNNSDTYRITTTLLANAIAFFIPFFLERKVIKFRKKYGFSIYKGIHKEVARLREQLLKDRNTIVVKQEGGVDKDDLGYWHSLLEKGAITQEEYEKKKRELLG